MNLTVASIQLFSTVLGFALVSAIVSFAWSPLLTFLLYKYNITRRPDFDPTMGLESRRNKAHVPVMGGLLVIITVALITFFFNWERSYTWVPVGVMLLSAALGAADDLLNIFGSKRRSRNLRQTLTLMRVHRDWKVRVWLTLTLPWSMFKRTSLWLGSHPGTGVYVHEKLLLQFIAGAITAWWIYFKLAEDWRALYVPFEGPIDIGWLIIPLIIFIVMFTANAVNIADGMDGLAGGMLIPTFGALAILSWVSSYQEMAILNATVMGALVAYTYYNVKPARFQMGDVGSLGLGALLAINAIVINQTAVLPLLGFMFYIEALTVVIQVFGRYLFGRRIFKMAPIHHHFELKGWSEEKTIMRFWIIHLSFVLLGMWIALH